MRFRLPLGAPVVVLLLAASAPALSAGGAASASASSTSAGSRGWVVDRVRFESIAPAPAVQTVTGLGAFRGAIEVGNAPAGGLAIVNDLGLEDYVRGVSEIPPRWPDAALQAQAIAARTYAVREVASTVATSWRGAGAHICATDSCQVYAGMAGEQRAGGERWSAAVDATAGQVLLSGGKPILAEYSSSNGGRSVAGSAPYLKSVDDPDDARSPLNRWTSVFPAEALARALEIDPSLKITDVTRTGQSVAVSLVEATPQPTEPPPPAEPPPPEPPADPPTEQPDEETGEEPADEPVEEMPASAPVPVSARTSQQEFSAGHFMARVNATVGAPSGLPLPLPSSRFDIRAEGGDVVVEGKGFGHGRGMSQWGAYGKAERGLSAADILAAYYDGIRPTTPEPDQLPATIKVALALGPEEARVSIERFSRVLDEWGTPVATAAFGEWTVRPEGTKVRVIPPEGQEETVTLPSVSAVPSKPVAGTLATVHVDVSAPAVLRGRFVAPDGQSGDVEPRLVEAGVTVLELPASRKGGTYEVALEADSGGGRQASAAVTFRVGGPNRGQVSGIRWRPPAPSPP